MDRAINHGDFGMLNRLPLELWHQILCVLPVKTLVTLCAVNKSFLSLIHHPDFASFHLQNFPNNHEPRLLNINCYSQPDNRCFYGIPEIKSFTEVLFTDRRLTWYVAGFIDGLLLLISKHHVIPLTIPSIAVTAVLWNPSIRKYRQLPLPSGMLRTFALGYDGLRNEHKVVATCEGEAWVYSVRTDSWTDVTWNVENGFRRCKFGDFMYYYDDSLSFKDGAVWTQSKCRGWGGFELVWFDFEAERFRYAKKMAYRWDNRRGLMMLDGGRTVGFWGMFVGGQMTASIWALQKDTMTWSKRYEILRKMVPSQVGFETVSFEESDGELVWKYRMPDGQSLEVSRYRLESKTLWRDQEDLSRFDGGYVSFYVETLFMLG